MKFLGTAGARFAVLRQLRYSAGTWLCLDGIQVLVDPGPGTLLRARRARPALKPERLSAIVLSHKHLDHTGDVNVMVDAMRGGPDARRGALLAPEDALCGDDPIVLQHVRPMLERIAVLQEGEAQTIGTVRLEPVPHTHDVITFGLVFEAHETRVGFVVDGRHHAKATDRYRDCELLVLNVVHRVWSPDNDHLSLPEALELLRALRPGRAVLTHFGMSMLRAGPQRLAEQASEAVGLHVIAASDGLILQLGLAGPSTVQDDG